MVECLDYPQANEMLRLRKRRTNQSSLTHQADSSLRETYLQYLLCDLQFAYNFLKVEGMWCLLYLIVTLCVGDLSVKIVNGFQPEVDYLERVGKNKLNFGHGVNFKYNGEIHNNLDRVWVVQRFNLPQELHNYVEGMNLGLDCSLQDISSLGVLQGRF